MALAISEEISRTLDKQGKDWTKAENDAVRVYFWAEPWRLYFLLMCGTNVYTGQPIDRKLREEAFQSIFTDKWEKTVENYNPKYKSKNREKETEPEELEKEQGRQNHIFVNYLTQSIQNECATIQKKTLAERQRIVSSNKPAKDEAQEFTLDSLEHPDSSKGFERVEQGEIIEKLLSALREEYLRKLKGKGKNMLDAEKDIEQKIERDIDVLILKEYEELTHKEIAERLDITMTNSRVILHRVKKIIRKIHQPSSLDSTDQQ